MYFNYDGLAYRSYSMDFSFKQLHWDMLLKFTFANDLRPIQEIEDCVNDFYISLRLFNGTNLAFAYSNRFFQSLFVGILPRLNLGKLYLRGSINSLKSISYILRYNFRNVFLYILLFHLQFKQGSIRVPANIAFFRKQALLYLGVFNSFYVKPLYDFGDREWLLRWSVKFSFINELRRFQIIQLLSFLKIFMKK